MVKLNKNSQQIQSCKIKRKIISKPVLPFSFFPIKHINGNMRNLNSIGLLFLFLHQSLIFAGERTTAGGRSLAMGGAAVAVNDFWSLGNNQAGAAWLKGICVGAGFENRFLLKELMVEQLGLAIPLKAGTFGLIVNRFGNAQFSELKAGLSYSRKFNSHFSVGVQLDYLRIHIADGYGNKNLVSCEIGLMYLADKHLGIGVQLLNPVPVKITGRPLELLPSIICLGLSYRFSDEFLTTFETEKDLTNPLIVRAGAEYHFVKPACVRIGISTSPVSFTFGFGLEFGRIKLDMASGYHQALGFSPSGSIIYSFK
jgi:hypothetical protein